MDPTDLMEFSERYQPTGNDLPEGIARMKAMDHAMDMWTEGETQDDVLKRAEAFYTFLTTYKPRANLWGQAN